MSHSQRKKMPTEAISKLISNGILLRSNCYYCRKNECLNEIALKKKPWFYSLPLICSMIKYVSYMEEEVLKLARENHHLIFQERQVPPQIMRLQLPVTAEIKPCRCISKLS